MSDTYHAHMQCLLCWPVHEVDIFMILFSSALISQHAMIEAHVFNIPVVEGSVRSCLSNSSAVHVDNKDEVHLFIFIVLYLHDSLCSGKHS